MLGLRGPERLALDLPHTTGTFRPLEAYLSGSPSCFTSS